MTSLIVIPCAHHVMAGLDPAISRQRQIRGSGPRMTYSKTVMAGLDPAIWSGVLDEITGSEPGDDVNLEEATNKQSK
jgi:hypothetical protein